MIVLSHYQMAPLLDAKQAGRADVTISLDLNRTTTDVTVSAEGVSLPGGPQLGWGEVERIAEDENKCFRLADDGTLHEIRTFSEVTNWVRSLFPTASAPTMLVSGLTMHRIVDTDPWKDTTEKVKAARPAGRVLDTATGLGYTAIQAAQRAESVVTVELDPACLDVARQNPWSLELFDNPKIEQVIGDAYDVVPAFEDASFNSIIHDPPVFSLAGHLYAGDFYDELYRVLSSRGRLFHYVGDPDSRTAGATTRGVIRRLQAAGFGKVKLQRRAYGVVAYK
jgi:hypothetical protein